MLILVNVACLDRHRRRGKGTRAGGSASPLGHDYLLHVWLLTLLSLLLTIQRSEGRPPSSATATATAPSPSPSPYSPPPPLSHLSAPASVGLSDEDEELRDTILEELGFRQQQLSHESNLVQNISVAEYRRAYGEYMRNVRARREGERGERDTALSRRRGATLLLQSIPPLKQQQQQHQLTSYSRSWSGTENEIVSEETGPGTGQDQILVQFPWTLFGPEPDKGRSPRGRILIRRATLFLPQNCVLRNGTGTGTRNRKTEDMTLKVIRWMEDIRTSGSLSLPLSVSLTCSSSSQREREREREELVAEEEPLLEILWMEISTKTTMAAMVEGRSRSRRAVHDNNTKKNHGKGAGVGVGERRGGGGGGGKKLDYDMDTIETADLEVSDFQAGGSVNETRKKNKRLGKRRGKDCKKQNGKSCCRKSQLVSFEDLKIREVILAPRQFDMGYCEGRCQAKRRLPYANNHAIFQAILIRNKGRHFAPKLCCTPTKFSEMDVIQRNPLNLEQLIVTVIRNAKVEECGCS